MWGRLERIVVIIIIIVMGGRIMEVGVKRLLLLARVIESIKIIILIRLAVIII
jgi:hypothetical protein